MMIAHASLPADDPKHVAEVLAEILEGEATRFPPGGPQAWMAWAGDDSIELEVAPRGHVLAHDPAQGAVMQAAEGPRGSMAHVAIGVRRPAGEIMEIAQREGWATGAFERGGMFTLVEVWVENAFLIEFMDPANTERYRASMTKANWKKVFGLAEEHA